MTCFNKEGFCDEEACYCDKVIPTLEESLAKPYQFRVIDAVDERNSKKTQREIVKQKLEQEGEVTNLWAIQHNIWRLGSIIHGLRKEGMEIETEYGTEKVGKNCHYKLKAKDTLF